MPRDGNGPTAPCKTTLGFNGGPSVPLTLPAGTMFRFGPVFSPDRKHAAVGWFRTNLTAKAVRSKIGQKDNGEKGGDHAGVLLFDLSKPDSPRQIGGDRFLTGAAYRPGGRHLAVSYRDGRLELRRMSDLKVLTELQTDLRGDTSVFFTSAGDTLGLHDGRSLRLIDLAALDKDLDAVGLPW